MQIRLPEQVNRIIEQLNAAGYEAYAVGGCVRDSLLGREPDDWDITTSALPLQVKALFSKTFDTGIQHGTVTVLMDRTGYEVTTYRIDGDYLDARHPSEVTFTRDLKEDLLRRDFTINAMAYNPTEGLVDLYDGQADLTAGCIRAVGDPVQRFTEDALRMMRAVRFSAQLGFSIESKTREAIRQLAPNLSAVSAERIQVELVKLLVSDHPEHMRILYELGLTRVFLPEFDVMMETPQNNPHHLYSVGEHTICALQEVPADRVSRLAMLFHDISKPECRTVDEDGIDHFRGHPEVGAQRSKEILRRLKFDNDTIKKVSRLVRWHDANPYNQERSVRRLMSKVGLEAYPQLFDIKRADLLAQSSYCQKEKLEALEAYRGFYQDIVAQEQCIDIKHLAIDGKDLMQLGFAQGPEIGDCLARLLDIVLDFPEYNTREFLLAFVKEHYL